jgi:hypothetical protein
MKKQFKFILVIPVLLLIAIATWAFGNKQLQPQPADKPLSEGWFVYNGGSQTSPNSYSPNTGSPNCPGAVTLCAIFADIDPSTGKPTQASINELRDMSNNFTEEVEGLVELKQ